MTSWIAMGVLVLIVVSSLGVFWLILRQMSAVTVSLSAYEEIDRRLEHSLEDQRRLAEIDPDSAERYRREFDDIAELRGHLRVLQLNRIETARRIEQILLGGIGVVLVLGLLTYLIERRSREHRLARLEAALEALSRGDGPLVVGDGRRDVVGRIASSVEKNSRIAAGDRRRLRYLEHLSAWQEAARRHAHEMRTPLTAARMEVDRFAEIIRERFPGSEREIEGARSSIVQELDKLREFTRNFTSFATIPVPQTRPVDLNALVQEFCATFANAWPGTRLVAETGAEDAPDVMLDADMTKQVFVNLATNSAMALGENESGTIVFRVGRYGEIATVDVIDDGSGVPVEIRPRLFEPYTTSRRIGEGMGLGLAISRKIMLDHGGDLDLLNSGNEGTTFRLTFPLSRGGSS